MGRRSHGHLHEVIAALPGAIRSFWPINELQRHTNKYPRGDVRAVNTADESMKEVKKTTLDDGYRQELLQRLVQRHHDESSAISIRPELIGRPGWWRG